MSDQPYFQNTAPSSSQPASSVDDLARVFNTALISSRGPKSQDLSFEIYQVMETPAFRAILNAVRQHARLNGISERQASEQVISTFRKMDELWSAYVFQEGVNQLKSGG
jgi:hypothetical protein